MPGWLDALWIFAALLDFDGILVSDFSLYEAAAQRLFPEIRNICL